jgi:hypothetical protein
VGRRRTSLRLALLVALVAVLGAIAATAAYALAFDDGKPCPANSSGVYVCPGGTVGGSYSVQLVGRGGCEPHFTFRVVNGALPAGLSMSSSGLISGRPTSSGTSQFWVVLADIPPSAGGPAWCTNPITAEREFRIDVLPGISIQNQTVKAGTIGQAYSEQLTALTLTNSATNPPTGTPATSATWSLFSGALPPGVTLAANGLLAGTPTAEGSYTFVVRAELDSARWDTETLNITVRQPLALQAPKPQATSPAPTLWEVSVPFSAKLTATGGTGTYTYTLAGGALPTGLALAADGTIAGTPTTAGLFRATVRLADTEGRTLDYAANFGIAAKLSISTVLLRPGKVGRPYRAKLATVGGIAPKKWKVVSGRLPKGIKLDRTLGILAGIPKKPGSYRVRFEAKDGLKVAARKTLRIVVAP